MTNGKRSAKTRRQLEALTKHESSTRKDIVQREEISKRDVESVKNQEQIRLLERQSNLAAWNDYIGFAVSKLLGVGGLIVGGLEMLDPNILPIVLENPKIVAGVGLALLTGKSVISLIAKTEKTHVGRS